MKTLSSKIKILSKISGNILMDCTEIFYKFTYEKFYEGFNIFGKNFHLYNFK